MTRNTRARVRSGSASPIADPGGPGAFRNAVSATREQGRNGITVGEATNVVRRGGRGSVSARGSVAPRGVAAGQGRGGIQSRASSRGRGSTRGVGSSRRRADSRGSVARVGRERAGTGIRAGRRASGLERVGPQLIVPASESQTSLGSLEAGRSSEASDRHAPPPSEARLGAPGAPPAQASPIVIIPASDETRALENLAATGASEALDSVVQDSSEALQGTVGATAGAFGAGGTFLGTAIDENMAKATESPSATQDDFRLATSAALGKGPGGTDGGSAQLGAVGEAENGASGTSPDQNGLSTQGAKRGPDDEGRGANDPKRRKTGGDGGDEQQDGQTGGGTEDGQASSTPTAPQPDPCQVMRDNIRAASRQPAMAGYAEDQARLPRMLFDDVLYQAIASVTEAIRNLGGPTYSLVPPNTMQQARLGIEVLQPIARPLQEALIPVFRAFRSSTGVIVGGHHSLFVLRRTPGTSGLENVFEMDHYDSSWRMRRGNARIGEEFVRTRDGLMRAGWAPEDSAQQGSDLITGWQSSPRACYQINGWTCGYHVILNAWATALGLALRPDATLGADFPTNVVSLVRLALQGRVDAATIKAFLECYGMVERGHQLPENRNFAATRAFPNDFALTEYTWQLRLDAEIARRQQSEDFPSRDEMEIYILQQFQGENLVRHRTAENLYQRYQQALEIISGVDPGARTADREGSLERALAAIDEMEGLQGRSNAGQNDQLRNEQRALEQSFRDGRGANAAATSTERDEFANTASADTQITTSNAPGPPAASETDGGEKGTADPPQNGFTAASGQSAEQPTGRQPPPVTQSYQQQLDALMREDAINRAAREAAALSNPPDQPAASSGVQNLRQASQRAGPDQDLQDSRDRLDRAQAAANSGFPGAPSTQPPPQTNGAQMERSDLMRPRAGQQRIRHTDFSSMLPGMTAQLQRDNEEAAARRNGSGDGSNQAAPTQPGGLSHSSQDARAPDTSTATHPLSPPGASAAAPSAAPGQRPAGSGNDLIDDLLQTLNATPTSPARPAAPASEQPPRPAGSTDAPEERPQLPSRGGATSIQPLQRPFQSPTRAGDGSTGPATPDGDNDKDGDLDSLFGDSGSEAGVGGTGSTACNNQSAPAAHRADAASSSPTPPPYDSTWDNHE